MALLVLSLEEMVLPPALETGWLGELPAARKTQLQGWPDADARRRSLLGNRLLREALRQLGHPAAALASLRYATHGKPTVDLPLHFSLAHCDGLILCAVSTQGPVGVDVEPLGPVSSASSGLYLNAAERAEIGKDPQRFYALWTRKEAVVKAGGTRGLIHMREFQMRGDRTEFAGQDWFTTALPLGENFVAHLAHARPWPGLTITRIAPETLL